MLLSRIAAGDGGVALAAAVSLSDAKRHINVYHDLDDALIASLVATAQAHMEGADGCGGTLGRAVSKHGLELKLPRFPAGRSILLPQPPLVSVESISYRDAAGAAQTFAAGHYHVVLDRTQGYIVLKASAAWPVTEDAPDAVAIRFTVGPDACPPDLQQAILLHIGHIYLNREAVGESASMLPFAYKALTDPHRTHGWI